MNGEKKVSLNQIKEFFEASGLIVYDPSKLGDRDKIRKKFILDSNRNGVELAEAYNEGFFKDANTIQTIYARVKSGKYRENTHYVKLRNKVVFLRSFLDTLI